MHLDNSKELTKRLPAVAGMFYPSNSRDLRDLINESFHNSRFGPGMMPPKRIKRKIYGIVSPHAGYVYSGAVAANGYYEISSIDFENTIMIGPNHYGIGSGVALAKRAEWETPFGEIEVNSDLSMKLYKKSDIIDFDDFAHSKDHCLEVQLPFLQYINNNFKIVPIILRMQDIETAHEIGNEIADTLTEEGDKTLLIASSDFTHYESNNEAHRKDNELIKSILNLDINKFYTVLERWDVSACGYGAIASIMVAAKSLGATRGELLTYATSGDVTGDTSAVVGYASIVFV
jgi:AmmeMemoRadiSam system protein B